MANRRPIKHLLLVLGGLLVLALGYAGYAYSHRSQLLNALHDLDPVIRMDAVRKAGKSDHEDLLIEALHDDDPDIRYVAAWSLGGEGSERKVRALLELCKDDHGYVR